MTLDTFLKGFGILFLCFAAVYWIGIIASIVLMVVPVLFTIIAGIVIGMVTNPFFWIFWALMISLLLICPSSAK